MVRKNFGQTQQKENKDKPSVNKRKRGWMIFGGVIVAIFAITQINSFAEQARNVAAFRLSTLSDSTYLNASYEPAPLPFRSFA